MAKHLTDADRAFRELVVALDGHQEAIASALGIRQSAVSQRLTTEKHGAWWRAFKVKRSKARRAARQRRWYEKHRRKT